MRKLVLIFVLLLISRSVAQTHPWDGIIAPGRATDWSHAGIPGGVPNITAICAITGTNIVNNVIQPSGDTSGASDTTTINTALQTCGTSVTTSGPASPPAGQVVQLAAGIFYTNGITFGNPNNSLQKSYVVLRGAGPDKTTLVTNGAIGCGQWTYVCMIGTTNYPGGGIAGSTQWRTGYAQGSTVIGVDSTAGMRTSPIGASGNIIILDQRDDSIGVCPSIISGGGAGPCAGVNGASESGTTVTIHTSYAHGYTVGECVGIGQVVQAWRVTNAIYTPGSPATVTLTIDVSSGPHNLFAGPNPEPPGGLSWGRNNTIMVNGITPSGYNAGGNGAVIKSVTTTTVTYDAPTGSTNPGTYSGGGIATNFRGYNSDTDQTISCTNSSGPKPGWATITAVPDSHTFQYTSGNSGLTPGGDGKVGADTGGAMFSAVMGATANEGGGNGRRCPTNQSLDTTCAVGEVSVHSPMEIKRVMDICAGGTWQVAGGACTANTVRIDPPLELPIWRVSQNPGVYWLGNNAVRDGIENLTLDMSYGNYDSAIGGMVLQNTYQSWVKNVRTLQGDRNHIWTQYDLQNTIRDNYFFGVKGTGNQSYGIEDWSSDGLNENNICQHIIACEMIGGNFGTVWGYNYAVDCPWGAAPLSMMMCANLNHDFAGMQLEEGDNTTGMLTDNIHGTSCCTTVFRTRLRSQDTPWKNNILVAQNNGAFNRANNIIDSVLGTNSGYLTWYDKRLGYDGPTIFNTGFQSENYQIPVDMLLRGFMFRWGNYDVCADAGNSLDTTATELPCVAKAGSNGIRFCGNASSTGFSTTCGSVSEVPTAGAPSAWIAPNPVPTVGDTQAGQTPFSASFYLPGQPLWWQTAWGTPGWPAIGSDVTASGPLDTTCTPAPPETQTSSPCDGVRHHSYQIPAQICWNNTPIDPAGTGPNGAAQVGYPITSPITSAVVSGWIQYTIPLPTGHVLPQPCAWNSNTMCMAVFTITGAQPADYNGTYMAAYTTATSVSFIRPNNPLYTLPAYQSGGTVNWPNVRLFNAAACYPVAYGGEGPPTPTTPPSIINGHGKITGVGKIT